MWVETMHGVTCGAWESRKKRMCGRAPARGHRGDWYGGGTIWLCETHSEQAAEGMIDAAGGIVVAAVAVIDGDGPLMSDAALAEYAAANPEPEFPVEAKPAPVPHVYVIERDRWVKIGKSINIPSRLKSLQNGGATMPDGMIIGPFDLLFTIPADCEAELHQRFSAYRDRGEWFWHVGEVAAWTAEMRRASPAPIKPAATSTQ